MSSIACPRCRVPMQPLVLASHKQDRPQLTVDHCPDCRSVWFDAFESVQLDGSGWVRLLRAMELAAARPSTLALAQPAVAQPACPACGTTLKTVHNRSRWGRFAVLECPQRHGHLHGHSGLLAERGLVRPLGVAERRALQDEKRSLHCLNCGGPASARDDECRWCKTPLVVIDLPRLAHSLQPRERSMDAAPGAEGRHSAWACRGCGAALDPGRETQCAHCGHLVVAQELPDIEPLLAAAEAALDAAGALLARVRDRFPSTHRERPAQPNDPRPDVASEGQRRLMLGGWLPLWLLLAASLLGMVYVAAGWHWWPRSAIETLRAMPVGHDAASGWAWAEAQRLLQPERTVAQENLQQGLLDLVLRERGGGRRPADATVGSLGDGRGAAPAFGLWPTLLAKALQPLPGSIDAPAPAGVVGDRESLAVAAPGLWIERDQGRLGVWRLALRNGGRDVLPVRAWTVITSPEAGPGSLRWRCVPAAGAPRWLRNGESAGWTCQVAQPLQQEAAWRALAYGLQDGQAPKLAFDDPGFAREGGAEAFVAAQLAEAAAHSVALDRFLRRHTALRNGQPPVTGELATPPSPTWAQRWKQLSTARRATLGLALAAASFVGFCALAQRFGQRRGGFVWWLLSLPPTVWAGGGEGAASVLLVGMYAALTAILAFVFAFAYRVYRARVFRRFAP